MPFKMPKTDDSSLNMTPMIDIVFQLILFFLFSLRFKSLQYRIETALPKDRGLQATPQMVQDIPNIKITLFRENAETAQAFTKLKIAGGNAINLKPRKWTRDMKTDTAIEDELDREYAPIQARIKELHDANKDLKGEIECPPPKGAAVPHTDVIRVLDCFLAAGVTEVNFVGASFPLPKSKGGSQN
jgi:biopolymer transport protein ExbD